MEASGSVAFNAAQQGEQAQPKRVLIIAPQFVPCSYPPSHRVRFFTQHLPALGWEPTVLCTQAAHMEEPADPEFCKLVPQSLNIVKTKALPFKYTRKLGLGDLGLRSLPYIYQAVGKLCAHKKFDLIFIPGPPWFPFVVGPWAKKKFGIPYVLDYIDPWVSSWGQGASIAGKAFWYRQAAKVLEPHTVRSAAGIVAVSEGTNEGVRACYPEVPKQRFTAIPYGAEPADFNSASNPALKTHTPWVNPFWNPEDGHIHMVYVGAMLPKAYGTLRALFAAVKNLQHPKNEGQAHYALAKQLKLHFFGTTYAAHANPKPLVLPVAKEMGLSVGEGACVTEHPARIPYLQSIRVLRSAHAVFGMGTSEAHYTASKIFPCVLSRTPLLAAYHEASSVTDILKTSGVGTLVTYNCAQTAEHPASVQALENGLVAVLKKAAAGQKEPLNMEAFAPFTAQAQAAKLADVFNSCAG